jgi:hypothetical protein
MSISESLKLTNKAILTGMRVLVQVRSFGDASERRYEYQLSIAEFLRIENRWL